MGTYEGIYVIDLAEFAVRAIVPLAAVSVRNSLAVTPDGRKLYVVTPGDSVITGNTLLAVDLLEGDVREVAIRDPRHVMMSERGDLLLVIARRNDVSCLCYATYALDTVTDSLGDRLPVRVLPLWFADESTAWFADHEILTIFDLESWQIVEQVEFAQDVDGQGAVLAEPPRWFQVERATAWVRVYNHTNWEQERFDMYHPTNQSPMYSMTLIDIGVPTCVGDCDGDGSVHVSELVVGVRRALGGADESVCIEGYGDGRPSISRLVKAVRAALRGCSP